MPPTCSNTSGPGRKSRWYVFARQIDAPDAATSSIERPRTWAWVATGMKVGVGVAPRRVCSRPARAPEGALARSS